MEHPLAPGVPVEGRGHGREEDNQLVYHRVSTMPNLEQEHEQIIVALDVCVESLEVHSVLRV